MPPGLEGFAPTRHLVRQDDKPIGADEIAQFMVIEFDRNDKRIVLSHTRLWEQEKEEEKQILAKEKRADAENNDQHADHDHQSFEWQNLRHARCERGGDPSSDEESEDDLPIFREIQRKNKDNGLRECDKEL